MNDQEAAAWEIHQFLQSLRLPNAVIGGLAVQWWGEPRVTKDVDLTVVAPLDQPSSVFFSRCSIASIPGSRMRWISRDAAGSS